jgi:hypothetical protein
MTHEDLERVAAALMIRANIKVNPEGKSVTYQLDHKWEFDILCEFFHKVQEKFMGDFEKLTVTVSYQK